jgi:hypothetical protein
MPPAQRPTSSSTACLARTSEHYPAPSPSLTYGDDLQILQQVTKTTPFRYSPRGASPRQLLAAFSSLLVGRWLGHPTAAPAPASLASHALQCLSPAIVSASVLSARRQSLSSTASSHRHRFNSAPSSESQLPPGALQCPPPLSQLPTIPVDSQLPTHRLSTTSLRTHHHQSGTPAAAVLTHPPSSGHELGLCTSKVGGPPSRWLCFP